MVGKKLLITVGILILLILSVFILMKIREKPEFGACETDADCKLVRCEGAYCDNGKCVCPVGGSKELSDVKVASLYERITDGEVINRDIDDVVNILAETKTDFIFRGFWKWKTPCFEEDKNGYSYSQLGESIKEIKKKMPDVIFCGSLGLQYFHEKDSDPLTGNPLDRETVKKMAFDPSKYGLDMTLEQLRDILHNRSAGEIEYIPDLTSHDFQKHILNLAKKQIDSGVDAIWIDGPYGILTILIAGDILDPSDPLIDEYTSSLSKIAEQIRLYGLSKYNKPIYVGSWGHFPIMHDCPFPDLDFITFTPDGEEILDKTLDSEKWSMIKEKAGDIPIFAFIDWSMRDDNPLAVFSQKLTPREQGQFLRTADEFFQKKEINFIYPIHGGWMGNNAKILSFSKEFPPGFRVYDSLAPEFGTYETIKELALKKAGEDEPVCGNQICEQGEDGYNCPEDCCVSGDGICPVGCTIANDDDCRQSNLENIRVASFYQTVTDGDVISRSIDEVSAIFEETKTDMVFRGFWRWNPVPESPDLAVSLEFPDEYVKEAEIRGYTYQQLKDATEKIKADIPHILFTGAVTTQRLNKLERNPITDKIFKQTETWEMAFNPEKWNLGVSKEETQCKLTKSWNWIDSGIECPQDYDPENAPAYFPDMTNEKFQELFLSWAKKQIDCGADIMWIDMLFKQANIIEKSYPGHAAVKESFEASSKVVDEIHKYGKSKDKQVYVGTWRTFAEFSYFPPNVDFVTATPSSEEVLNRTLDSGKWNNIKLQVEGIEKKLGKDIPVFVFIDVGNDKLPIAAFSQKMTPAQQNEFLEYADNFFNELDMVFVYPVHGGFMGQHAEMLSFGMSKNYDSLAPEFQTYETIKELALKKAGE